MAQQTAVPVSFTEVDILDVLDAARTFERLPTFGVMHQQEGIGYQELMSWALSDIGQAQIAEEYDQVSNAGRHASSAVMHARRSLDCMIDFYLRSQGFDRCKDAPRSAKAKGELIRRRGLVDDLTSRVVRRAIDRRDRIEHDYVVPSVGDAEDIVELMRRTIQHIESEVGPDLGPFLFGSRGVSYGQRAGVRFLGWLEQTAFAVITFVEDPWCGVIRPKSDSLEVERAFLRNCPLAVYEELIDEFAGRHALGSYSSHCAEVAIEIGLVEEADVTRLPVR